MSKITLESAFREFIQVFSATVSQKEFVEIASEGNPKKEGRIWEVITELVIEFDRVEDVRDYLHKSPYGKVLLAAFAIYLGTKIPDTVLQEDREDLSRILTEVIQITTLI